MGVVAPQGLEPEFGGNVEPFTLTMSNLVRSNIVAETVIRNLGLQDSTQDLLGDVRVQSKPSTAALEVSYDSTNKQKAVAVLSEIGYRLRATRRSEGARKSAPAWWRHRE